MLHHGAASRYKEIPYEVVCDGCDWLRSNLAIARTENRGRRMLLPSGNLQEHRTMHGESPFVAFGEISNINLAPEIANAPHIA